jgi:hypothetical protein
MTLGEASLVLEVGDTVLIPPGTLPPHREHRRGDTADFVLLQPPLSSRGHGITGFVMRDKPQTPQPCYDPPVISHDINQETSL